MFKFCPALKRSSSTSEAAETEAPVRKTLVPMEMEESDVDKCTVEHEKVFVKYILTNLLGYVPLRLTGDERSLLELLCKGLNVSEYTDHVDNHRSSMRDHLIQEHLNDFYHIVLGLQTAANHTLGKKLAQRSLKENGSYFADLFEVGRRYKMMNPNKMRSDYGKLLFVLQDACNPRIEQHFGFRPYKKIKNVKDELQRLGLLDVLIPDGDKIEPRLLEATQPLHARGDDLQEHKDKKEKLLRSLVEEYGKSPDDKEALERCIRSIDDCNCYVRDNVSTLQEMILLLEKYFEHGKKERSLDLPYRVGGSRLQHSHSEQFEYVRQTMELWKLVSLHMFKLWDRVERDMVTEGSYSFRYTGQGFNRVMSSYNTGAAMRELVQKAMAGRRWVGLSAVHLGDDQVPNPLVFIDKYTQISRIINPILQCIRDMGRITAWPGVEKYIISTWGGVEECRVEILRDYFKHGFDGSGGDNPADAGSCIDGRLTSTWNWCNKIGEKPYVYIFRLTGFTSFDAF